jgi:hypothetical protein
VTYTAAIPSWFVMVGVASLWLPAPTVPVAMVLLGVTLLVPTTLVVWSGAMGMSRVEWSIGVQRVWHSARRESRADRLLRAREAYVLSRGMPGAREE